jgi:hypothetical protein
MRKTAVNQNGGDRQGNESDAHVRSLVVASFSQPASFLIHDPKDMKGRDKSGLSDRVVSDRGESLEFSPSPAPDRCLEGAHSRS